jgi:hypothetical protein
VRLSPADNNERTNVAGDPRSRPRAVLSNAVGEEAMAGDPKECRQRAVQCADLAHTARTPELKTLLINLSQNWLKLAIELERTQLLLDEWSETPRKAG